MYCTCTYPEGLRFSTTRLSHSMGPQNLESSLVFAEYNADAERSLTPIFGRVASPCRNTYIHTYMVKKTNTNYLICLFKPAILHFGAHTSIHVFTCKNKNTQGKLLFAILRDATRARVWVRVCVCNFVWSSGHWASIDWITTGLSKATPDHNKTVNTANSVPVS
jgi:hypothetical protein